MVSGRTGGYSSEVDMGRKRVQLLMLLTFVMTFMVAVTNCADRNTTVRSTTAITANTTTSRNATKPASTPTTVPAISDKPATLPPPDPSVTIFLYTLTDPETGMGCHSVDMSISIRAKYMSTDDYMRKTVLKIPATAEVRGTCGGVAPTMELIWADDPTLEGTLNRITLMISRRHLKFSAHVIGFEIYIDGKNFPDALQEGRRFKCELLGLDEFSASKNNGLYGCEPEITANTVDVNITIHHFGLGIFFTGDSFTSTEENDVSGADMAQWSGYLLLAAKILIFLKLGHQGI